MRLGSPFWTLTILLATTLLLDSCGQGNDGGATNPCVNTIEIPAG